MNIYEEIEGNEFSCDVRTKMAAPSVIRGFQGGSRSEIIGMVLDFNHANFQNFTKNTQSKHISPGLVIVLVYA